MPERIRVGIAFPVSDEVVAQIEAVDPRIEAVRMFGLSSSTMWSDGANTDKDALLRDVASVEVLFGPSAVPAEFFRSATDLKWFQVINAGVDRLHREGLLDLGFKVTNVSGLTAPAIAEYVIGSIIMMAKGMPAAIQNQANRSWSRIGSIRELGGATLGIVGMGAIGRETAVRARPLGMHIVASRRTVAAGDVDPDCDLLLPYSANAQLLAQSDYIVLCVPLTPETRHMIGREQFLAMKPSAVIVNIARGAVIDQPALIQALRDGAIAGAVLDVTDPEPLPADDELWHAPNVIITPHISGTISGYGHRAADMFVANLRRYVAGEPLHHLVDPVLGY